MLWAAPIIDPVDGLNVQDLRELTQEETSLLNDMEDVEIMLDLDAPSENLLEISNELLARL